MKQWIRCLCVGVTAAALLTSACACRTSSHRTFRTHEETNEPETAQGQEQSGEWQMKSQGETVVDP